MGQRIYNIIVALFILFFLWYIYSDTKKQKDENVESVVVDSVTSNTQVSSTDREESLENELAVALQQEIKIVRKGQEMLLKELEEKERESAREKRENRAKEEAFEEELMEEERAIREAREKAEREAREKALAEERAKKQAALEKANQLGALFGNTDSPEGGNGSDRESAYSATKGNPVGYVSSGGNTWSLNGRGLRGELPKPSQDFKQEGTVKVAITVDKEGNVVAAKAIGGSVNDEKTRQLAIDTALKAKFTGTDRPDKQMGTITYTFKYKLS